MGHRTLSLSLIWHALSLHPRAYDELRDDDNPVMEGLFLVALVSAAAALLALVGQLLGWASLPTVEAMREAVWQNLLPYLQDQPWWAGAAAGPDFLNAFRRTYDLGWQVFPPLLGMPDPRLAALNILIWPLQALLAWLLYGLLATAFGRLLGGTGTLNQSLGTTALAAAPLALRGLGLFPFVTLGAALTIWQLLCRFQAVRSSQRLSWGRALWATLLPYAVYLLFWIAAAAAGWNVLRATLGR